MQREKMLFCPLTGKRGPVPDSAAVWRNQHQVVWLFNPWTGEPRERMEIERDEVGRLLFPPGDSHAVEWLPEFVKTGGAIWSLGALEGAGWTVDLDIMGLAVTASKGGLMVSFRLNDPMEEERYYTLVHSEASGSCLR